MEPICNSSIRYGREIWIVLIALPGSRLIFVRHSGKPFNFICRNIRHQERSDPSSDECKENEPPVVLIYGESKENKKTDTCCFSNCSHQGNSVCKRDDLMRLYCGTFVRCHFYENPRLSL
jgi:hypothetical protein